MSLKGLWEFVNTPMAYNGHPRLSLAFLVAAAAVTPVVALALGTEFCAAIFHADAATKHAMLEIAMIGGALQGLQGGYLMWRNNAWLTAPRPEPELRP